MKSTAFFLISYIVIVVGSTVAMIHYNEPMFMLPITFGIFRVVEYTNQYRMERRNG